MKEYKLKEYLVCFQKDGDEQKGTGDFMTIGAASSAFLKEKIVDIMKKDNYIRFFFTKKENIGTIEALDFMESVRNNYDKFMELF